MVMPPTMDHENPHEGPEPETERPVPDKAGLKAVVSFNDSHGIKYRKRDLFRYHHIPERTGHRLLASISSRKDKIPTTTKETRGRQRLISQEKIIEMDRLLQSEGFDTLSMTWQQLACSVGLESVSGRTVARALGNSMQFMKCIACQRGWVSEPWATDRVRFATEMLQKYPKPEDWFTVRFTEKLHFGWGPQGKLRFIPKPGERYHSYCLQEVDELKEKDRRRLHAWASVGYNFKSDLVFYSAPANQNGKMSMKVYLEQILKPIVGKWIDQGDNFILEEDSDSSHGTGKSNEVRDWKERKGLQYYFNCAHSPDLSPIGNCCQAPKQTIRAGRYWDAETTQELIVEGYEKLSQETINRWIISMPDRLRQVIASGGKLIGS